MDGAITLLLVVGAICLVVLAWAGRKRFPLRIGAGNFFRRKTQVAIVVAGLLIGTAIITSSYVIQSTFDYTVKAAVFRALDAVFFSSRRRHTRSDRDWSSDVCSSD